VDGACRYTEIKSVKLNDQNRISRIYPQPASDELNIRYYSYTEGPGTIAVTDISGRTIMRQSRNLDRGSQAIILNTELLISGIYFVTITDKLYEKTTQKFIRK